MIVLALKGGTIKVSITSLHKAFRCGHTSPDSPEDHRQLARTGDPKNRWWRDSVELAIGVISTIDFLKARFTESLEHKGALRHLSNSIVRGVIVTPKTEIGTLECDYSLFHSSLKTSV